MKKTVINFSLISLIVIVVIFVQMLFYENFELDKCNIINALYIISCLSVMVYSFITSRYHTLNQLSFGYTRKEIYFDYLKRILLVLGYIILVILVYLLWDLVIYNHNSFKDFFNSRKLIFFISCYLLFASSGFFQGIFKLKSWIALIVMTSLSIVLIMFNILRVHSYIISIPIMIISLALFFVNSKLIYKINILD